ncbi:MAG: LPS-assembly protein LptD, partial [Muribaculaceae bacterium]|nr:LPS-assembly protein LptD [Muribaculaceae bacterium]
MGLHTTRAAEPEDTTIATPDSAAIGPDSTACTMPDSTTAPDSIEALRPDSIAPAAAFRATDSVPQPRSRMVRTMVDLDNAVQFSSSDSMIIVRRDSAFMYGNSSVTYGEIKLDAAQIEMNLGDNTVYAVGRPDSVGEMQGNPIFHEASGDYEASTMRYNFKTEKGIISNVITQQGEGYLTGGLTKKDVDDSYYIKSGRYTTCDDHDDPHFYLQLTKAKVRPGKNIVVGPSYMVLAGLPLPLAVPFGYFPFSDKYASGIIIPTFGEDYNRGFYARE